MIETEIKVEACHWVSMLQVLQAHSISTPRKSIVLVWSMPACEQWCFRRLWEERQIPWPPVTAWVLQSRTSGCYFSSFVSVGVLHVCIHQKDCAPVCMGMSLMYVCGEVRDDIRVSSITSQSLSILSFSFSPKFLGGVFFSLSFQCSELVKYLDNFWVRNTCNSACPENSSTSCLLPKEHPRVAACL